MKRRAFYLIMLVLGASGWSFCFPSKEFGLLCLFIIISGKTLLSIYFSWWITHFSAAFHFARMWWGLIPCSTAVTWMGVVFDPPFSFRLSAYQWDEATSPAGTFLFVATYFHSRYHIHEKWLVYWSFGLHSCRFSHVHICLSAFAPGGQQSH